jgi:hypothetical protein
MLCCIKYSMYVIISSVVEVNFTKLYNNCKAKSAANQPILLTNKNIPMFTFISKICLPLRKFSKTLSHDGRAQQPPHDRLSVGLVLVRDSNLSVGGGEGGGGGAGWRAVASNGRG